MIDKIDRKILYELDLDARIPLTKLAKKIKINKDTLAYRIKRLEAENIILGYQTFVNHGKLGYFGTRINLQLQNTTPEIEGEMIHKISNHSLVGFFASVEGNFNYTIWVVAKSIQELDYFWENLKQNYEKYLQKVSIGIYTRIDHYPRVSLINKKINSISIPFYTVDKPEQVDAKDLAILKVIAKNARISILDLAKNVKIAAKTAANRLRQLEKRKIISGYSVILNTEKIGYDYFKILIDLQNITPNSQRKLDQWLLEHPHVTYRDYVIGGSSVEIELQLPNSELRNFIDELKREFSAIIRQHEILHYYKEHKLLSMPW